MKNLIKQIYDKVSGKQVIITTVIFVLFTALVLPYIATLTSNVIGVSESPDTSFDYNLSALYNLMNEYGQDGRQFYVMMRWTFDIVWPLIYTAFLLSITGYLARKSNIKFQDKLLFIPLFAVLFDLLENTNITILMLAYPRHIDVIGYLFMVSSMLKWLMITASFLLIIILAFYLLYQHIKNKK